MVVEDYMNVCGRGWLIIVYGKDLNPFDIHCEDKIVRGDTIFTITGVERMRYDCWWKHRAGLILSPNNKVPDLFDIGQEIEIIPRET